MTLEIEHTKPLVEVHTLTGPALVTEGEKEGFFPEFSLTSYQLVGQIMKQVDKPLANLALLTDAETHTWREFVGEILLPFVADNGRITPEWMSILEANNQGKGVRIEVARKNSLVLTAFFKEGGRREDWDISANNLPAAVVISQGGYLDPEGQNLVIAPFIHTIGKHIDQTATVNYPDYPAEIEGVVEIGRRIVKETAKQIHVSLEGKISWISLIKQGGFQQLSPLDSSPDYGIGIFVPVNP